MKVLLIQPPHYYGKKTRLPSFFPLGLGYIARALKNNSYDTEIFDIWANQFSNDEVVEKIKTSHINVIGISALSSQYYYVKWLVGQIRKYQPKSKIVLGGALASLSPEIVLSNTETDICVLGEGEHTFVNLLKNIEDYSNVKGIYYKKRNSIKKNPMQEYIKDLDTLDFPAWEMFQTDVYVKNSYLTSSYYPLNIGVMNIVCGRGCPWNCNYCSKTFTGTRLRSIDNVISEIKELIHRYNIKGIFFNDELLAINKERVFELCEKIKPLKLKWQCQARVNLVDYDLLTKMKSAGCVSVGYGVESGSQTILNNMNKKVNVKQAEDAIKNTYRAGIFPMIQMMYGYPGENRNTLNDTVNFFKRTKAFYFGKFFITTPLPGTKLYDSCLNKGQITDEEKYLLTLDAGYHSERESLINLSDLKKADFYKLKKKTEKRIYLNSIISKPLFSLKFLYYNIKKYGWVNIAIKIKNLIYKK